MDENNKEDQELVSGSWDVMQETCMYILAYHVVGPARGVLIWCSKILTLERKTTVSRNQRIQKITGRGTLELSIVC